MSYHLANDVPPPSAPTLRRARHFVAVVLGVLLSLGLGCGGLAVYLGAPTGDLVRIGGLSQRAFGPDQVPSYDRRHFSQRSFADLMAGADPGDILIFGDSFTQNAHPDAQILWMNRLHADTGLEVTVIPGGEFTRVQQYLASEAFAQTPPRALLVQTVERNLLQRAASLHDPAQCSALTSPTGPNPPLSAQALADPPQLGSAVPAHRFEDMDDVLSWGMLAMRVKLKARAHVVKAPLSNSELFSSKASDTALFYHEDFSKFTPEFIARFPAASPAEHIRCAMTQLTHASGDVPLWVMVAPDKRTIYEPWLATAPAPKPFDAFALGTAAIGPAFLDLKPVLQGAVEAGQKDIYAPDDTHWGYSGHQLVGEFVAKALTGQD